MVVQDVFLDGLIAQDGRLQPGDQIIEVNGVDMTGATHQQVGKKITLATTYLMYCTYILRVSTNIEWLLVSVVIVPCF